MKLKLALLLACLLQLSAIALPGDSYSQIDSWVKSHSFLSPWLTGNKGDTGYFQHYLTAFRQLQDNWFLEVSFTLKGEKPSIKTRKSAYESLMLLKKEFDANLDTESKWRYIDCKDVWFRDNENAYKLINGAYSKDIAEDFKNAKLIYDGPVALIRTMGWGHGLEDPDFQDLEEAKQLGMDGSHANSLFIGKKFGYRKEEIKEYLRDRNWDDPKNDSLDPKSCYSLSIYPIEKVNSLVNTLNHNMKIYQAWSNYESQKQKRLEPADISVE